MDKGFFGALKQIDIPLDSITGISVDGGIINGTIIMAHTRETAIEDVSNAAIKPFVDSVNLSIKEMQDPFAKQTPPPQTQETKPKQKDDSKDDSIEQIEKLAALKDRGIITEEEFTTKKAQILGI